MSNETLTIEFSLFSCSNSLTISVRLFCISLVVSCNVSSYSSSCCRMLTSFFKSACNPKFAIPNPANAPKAVIITLALFPLFCRKLFSKMSTFLAITEIFLCILMLSMSFSCSLSATLSKPWLMTLRLSHT